MSWVRLLRDRLDAKSCDLARRRDLVGYRDTSPCQCLTQQFILRPQLLDQREIFLLAFLQPVHAIIQPIQILTL